MKQSKKLLSIFLAMLMLLGTVSVIGNAGYTKAEMAYDSVDNPAPTYQQVVTLVLDVLDQDVLSGIDVDIDILGIKISLTSVDNVFATLDSVDGIKGLAGGDLKKLNFDAVDGKQTRAKTGDLQLVYNLLQFLADNSSILGKAAYGLDGGDGIDLGLVGSFVDLGDINDIVGDLPGFATKMVYDMLIYGSYDANGRFDKDAEEHGTLPTDVDSLDEIINVAVTGLLTKPQNYTWEPTGQTDANGNPITKKVWDMNSYILDASKIEGKDLTLTNNSVFSLLDSLLQIAYEDFGTVFLNNDLKKNLMRALGADFVTLDETVDAAEIAKITKAGTGYIDVATASADKVALVKNYFCNAQMWKVDGTWYYRGYKTVETGEVDAEGNAITVKKDIFQRANIGGTDSLFNLVNWDYNLTGDTLDFDTLIPKYGSIIGCLNHLIYVLFDNAINFDVLGIKVTDIWKDGDNSNFNENLMTTAKFLLKNFTFMFFGRNEAYVDLNTFKAKPEFVAKIDSFSNDAAGREGLIAYMLLPMLGDVLPQLVYDVDMFTDGLQIEQTAVLLVREFLSDLTPQINYDDQIFADASLKTGRKFQTKTSAQWIELLLNMGLDLGATYLDNICNIALDAATLKQVKEYAVAAGHPAYMGVLEEIVDYAVNYIGEGNTSILAGCDPTTLNSVRCVTAYDYKTDKVTVANNYAGNAFTILSTILNKLLPLGLLCNVSSADFALDVKMVFDRLIDVIDDLDLEVLLGTFGRNGRDDNLLGATNIVNQLLDNLINRLISVIFGKKLFPVTSSLNAAVTKANIKQILINLLTGLNGVKTGLLPNALPIVAAFVDDWGSEQALRSPTLNIGETTRADGGSLNYTVTLTNGSRGIWRGYMKDGARAQDEQYAYEVTSIESAQNRLTIGSGWSGKLDFGTSKTFTISGTVPAEGIADKLTVNYKVYDEDGQAMDGGKTYQKSYYTYFSFDNDQLRNAREGSKTGKGEMNAYMPQNIYYAEEDLPNIANDAMMEYYCEKDDMTGKLTDSSGTQNGITLNNISVTAPSDGGSSYGAPFTFNPSAYTSVGHAGAVYTFTYKLHNGNKDGSYSSKLFVYSGADYNLLADLVNNEVSVDRKIGEYKDATAYGAYLGALANGMAVVYNPRVDSNFWTDCYARYEALSNAITALEATKIPASEQTGETIGAAVTALEKTIDSIQTSLNGKDYRSHMLYRWSRYQDAKKDAAHASYIVEKYNAGLQTQKFEYGSLPIYKVTELIKGDSYEKYIKSLYVDLNEEELANATNEYKNIVNEYSGYTTLDIAQIQNLATRMSQRLLPREGGVVNTYLSKEIESAKAAIGTSQGNYSDMSWAVYTKALSDAEAAMTSASQDTIFNAKYALQVARNNLVTKDNEADYSELKELIAQAENAVKNASYYKNADVDFGRVLAALGYEVNGTEIFPGAAKDVVATSYSKHDQDEIDDAADELKAALAKLEFKDFANKKPSGVNTTAVATGEQDETGNAITENIYTKKIEAKQVKKAVADALAVSGCTVEVSLDSRYSATSDANLEKIPVGTGATVTILQKVDGVNVPVATIKLIVEGDVTGDGVIDALDCMIADLCVNDQASLDGIYLIAGDLQANNAMDKGDFSAIVNKAIPDVVA